jgi:hypothetical protein
MIKCLGSVQRHLKAGAGPGGALLRRLLQLGDGLHVGVEQLLPLRCRHRLRRKHKCTLGYGLAGHGRNPTAVLADVLAHVNAGKVCSSRLRVVPSVEQTLLLCCTHQRLHAIGISGHLTSGEHAVT